MIRRQGGGVRETFTVRKVSFGVGVERTFPLHSPVIDSIEVVTRGDVRRAKLYYLRDLRGKAAKIKEKRDTVPARASGRPDRGPAATRPVALRLDESGATAARASPAPTRCRARGRHGAERPSRPLPTAVTRASWSVLRRPRAGPHAAGAGLRRAVVLQSPAARWSRRIARRRPGPGRTGYVRGDDMHRGDIIVFDGTARSFPVSGERALVGRARPLGRALLGMALARARLRQAGHRPARRPVSAATPPDSSGQRRRRRRAVPLPGRRGRAT